jgi:hypothetical protein
MKKRTMKSFKSWDDAQKDELETIRKTSGEERLKILEQLIMLQEELPKQNIYSDNNNIPVIFRRKN